jgi:serine/threonine-protein kinase
VWVDREGREEPIVAGPNSYLNPRISPDGKKVALSIEASGNRDIWIWELLRKTLTRLTFDEGPECSPVWTLDGQRIAFLSLRYGKAGVYWKAADGTGKEELLYSVPGLITFPASWSDNGKTMVGAEWELGRMNFDIGILPTGGDGKPRLLLKEKYYEAQPQVSPDGRWIAYTSNESGQNQVCVRPFPEVEGGLWQVSTTGGDSPLWSPDSREIFFRNGDAVMGTSLRTDPTFSFETPKMLFRGTYVRSVLAFGNWDFATWDISPDGQRFLMMKELAAATAVERGLRKITVILNWYEEIKRLVPTGKK